MKTLDENIYNYWAVSLRVLESQNGIAKLCWYSVPDLQVAWEVARTRGAHCLNHWTNYYFPLDSFPLAVRIVRTDRTLKIKGMYYSKYSSILPPAHCQRQTDPTLLTFSSARRHLNLRTNGRKCLKIPGDLIWATIKYTVFKHAIPEGTYFEARQMTARSDNNIILHHCMPYVFISEN